MLRSAFPPDRRRSAASHPRAPRDNPHQPQRLRAVSDAVDFISDPLRLAALADTGLPDSPPQEVFDRLTALASRLLKAPIAAMTLVDDRRQFIMSHRGLPDDVAAARETPISHSICARVVAGAEPLLVRDTLADPRLATHPAACEMGMRAYAGFPVLTRDGHALGSLCVCDTEPHDWSDDDVETLAELAALASVEVDRARAAADAARTEQLLRDAGGWLRSLVEQSIMAIYCYQDGRFRYANPKTAEIFGYPEEELRQPGALARIIHPDDYPRMAENIRLRLVGEIPTIRYTLRGVRPNGDIVYLDVHGSRTDIDGRPALIGVGYDITDRVRAEREREGARAARDRFYAMASHELRTPVSTVMLYNDLLLGGMYDALTPSQREAVERSQSSARHLLGLINDLLDLSKMEAGRMETRREPVDLAQLVREVTTELEPMAHEYGSTLTLALEDCPDSVIGDETRIRQILLNLLSNAIKFGQGRPIEVRCEGTEDGGVSVHVADHGEGIEAEDLPRIWEDFVQLGTTEHPGTGLGLPIARRLAELLGGSLDAVSTPGIGSTFRLELPGPASVASAGTP